MNKDLLNTILFKDIAKERLSNFSKEGKCTEEIELSFIGTGKKVLDIGCCDGYLSQLIKNAGNEVIGVDISSEHIKKCKKKGIDCIVHDIETPLPFHDNSFDIVFCGDVIEHLFDTDAFLQEARRVLKKGGYIIISTPNLAALTRRIRLLCGINPHIDISLKKGRGHIRYYTFKSLKELLSDNGFIIETQMSNSISLNRLRMFKLAILLPKLGTQIIVKAKMVKG